VLAGAHRLNGNGEMTGLEWVRECGMLTPPVALTNTHSVGVVREAIAAARGGPVEEGAVGAGTGMICHGLHPAGAARRPRGGSGRRRGRAHQR